MLVLPEEESDGQPVPVQGDGDHTEHKGAGADHEGDGAVRLVLGDQTHNWTNKQVTDVITFITFNGLYKIT